MVATPPYLGFLFTQTPLLVSRREFAASCSVSGVRSVKLLQLSYVILSIFHAAVYPAEKLCTTEKITACHPDSVLLQNEVAKNISRAVQCTVHRTQLYTLYNTIFTNYSKGLRGE